MGTFISQVPNALYDQTADTIKVGPRDTVVTVAVTIRFTTIEIIHKAIELKVNLIIPHEPTFSLGRMRRIIYKRPQTFVPNMIGWRRMVLPFGEITTTYTKCKTMESG